MKKTMKKMVSLVLTLAMVLGMSMTAFAADTYTITAPEGTTHTYEIYQIFTGDYSNGVLSNVKWGTNGTEEVGSAVSDTVLEALEALSGKTDTEKLEVIETYADLTGTPVATVGKDTDSSASVAPGYYLIKDVDGSVTGNDAYTKYIVKVVGDVTITPKSAVPDFQKKVKDTNDTTGETSEWQDSADYDIGDAVPFQLKGTVASNYDQYTTYYFAFHDVEEAGLTFDPTSVKVYVDGTPIESGYELVTSPEDGCTFEVVFADLKQVASVQAGSVITVEYTSTLNGDANLGEQGNVNKAKLVFSNNPNSTQSGSGSPDTPDTPDTGETPWDNVIVFTYKVVVNKVDENTTPLPGAEFTLEKEGKDGSWTTITVVKNDEGTSFTFSGLDDGNYRLTETVTPDGYNTIAPITFTVAADHTITWETGDRTTVLTSISGNKVSGEITFTAAKSEGSLSADIVNKAGSTLPETGGIGTTIFYVLGVILVLGAAIALIVRKRMSTGR